MADIKDIKLGNTKYNIKIPSSRVKSMADYAKPSSKPSPEAIQQSDTLNAALGKLEYKADTNQTNILYTLGKTGKNLLSLNTIPITWSEWNIIEPIKAGTYILHGVLPHKPQAATDVTNYAFDFKDANDNTVGSVVGVGWENIYNNGMQLTLTGTATKLKYWAAGNTDDATNMMVCTPEDWAIGHDYAPFALPNADLTYLEAEDREALAEVVDSGAKNEFEFGEFTPGGTTITITGDAVTISGTAGWAKGSRKFRLVKNTKHIISYTITESTTNGAVIMIATQQNGGGTQYFTKYHGSTSGTYVEEFYAPVDTDLYFVCTINNSAAQLSEQVTMTLTDIMICSQADWKISPKYVPFGNDPFYQVPINHNMIYRGKNLGDTLTDAQHTALSSGNFTDLYLGDYWTKSVTIPAGRYTDGDGQGVAVPAQTNITLKVVIADFDTFYAGYVSNYAGINTHHAAVIVTGFSNVVWNSTNTTAGGYVNSLIHKWLVGSALPQIETWFGSAKVLSHQKSLTNAITGDAASGCAWSSQKISLLSENQMYGSKVWGNSKAANGGYEPGEAFKHLNVFNHIDANLLFGNKNIWLRDIASAVGSACLGYDGLANNIYASAIGLDPAALILLS